MPTTCTMCKKRQAVYYRTFSGDKLCIPCLRRQLQKQVKHSLGSKKILKPRQNILIILSPLAPLQSITLSELAVKIESKYGSKVILLLNKSTLSIGDNTRNNLEEMGAEIVEIGIEVKRSLSVSECMRAERAIAIQAARSIGADAVVAPYTRDLHTVALIEAMTKDWTLLSEAEDSWPSNPPAISGLSSVESEAAAAYAALNGYDATPLCKPQSSIPRLLRATTHGRPELVYSSVKTGSLLAGEAARLALRCPSCGGYTLEDGVCRICRLTLQGAP